MSFEKRRRRECILPQCSVKIQIHDVTPDANLLSRIRELEADITMKDKEISMLNSQFKDSEDRNAALRQVNLQNYEMSCSASPNFLNRDTFVQGQQQVYRKMYRPHQEEER